VHEEPTLPDGYDLIGRVSSRCLLRQGIRPIDEERLSDVDCSERRVAWALRERAAEVGGELLVGRACFSQPTTRQRVRLLCKADVARPSEETLAQRRFDGRPRVADGMSLPGGTPTEIERLDEPNASTAWRILVDFTPAPRAAERPPRRTDLVRELAVMPVSHRRLGDVITTCEAECSEHAVREGVRIAAGRMGATDVVDVRCARRSEGLFCAGTAAAYEVDPERDPRAR
jgi:hypothetical protein